MHPPDRRRVLVDGAGRRGAAFARMVSLRGQKNIEVVGFVDDDASLRGKIIEGAQVLGDARGLPEILRITAVDEILVATDPLIPGIVQKLQNLVDRPEISIRMLIATAEEMSFGDLSKGRQP
jgi:FlaA1/EpsC-like NDP-sugar epimerase